MLSKEYRTIFGGAVVLVFVTALLNLLLKFGVTLSVLVGILCGVVVGLLIDKFGGR